MCTHMQKDYVCTIKTLRPMSEFGGLWNQQNNSACTKTAKSLPRVGAGHNMEEEEEEKRTVRAMQSLLTASDTGGSAVLAALPLATGVCRKSGLMSGTSTGKRGSMKVVARMMWSMKNG